jgi:DNA-binding transcriptional MerR regulator
MQKEYNFPDYMNKEVAAISGMNPKTIGYHTNSGLVVPTISPGKGKGSNRLYSTSDVLKFMLIPVLSDHGLNLKQVKRVFELVNRDLFRKGNPYLYHGCTVNRVFIGVYDIAQDDFAAQVVYIPDSETCDPSVKEGFAKNLEYFTVDMLNHKSVLLVDISESIRRLPVL